MTLATPMTSKSRFSKMLESDSDRRKQLEEIVPGPDMRSHRRFTADLPTAVHDRLRRESARLGVPMIYIVLAMLNEHLPD